MELCFIWLRDLGTKKIGAEVFEELEENVKWSEKVTNEQVLDLIGEKRTLINNIQSRKVKWIGHILRKKLPPS